MNRPTALLPLAVVLFGCARTPETPPGPALRCDAPGAAMNVYVEIVYAPDGMPIATPDTCTVARRAQVEWRGPDGNTLPFDIRFKHGNPVPAAPEGRLHSKAAGARQAVSARVDAAPGRYDYAIRAGSQERDPAIIIR